MEITANATQTVALNQNVIFTDTPIEGCKAIIHRDDSGLITLRGFTDCEFARFKAIFSGNIAIPALGVVAPISLALSLNGEPVATTTMTVTPTAVGGFFNVSSSIYILVPKGCCQTLAVENISTQGIEVANANLIIEKVA